MARKDIAKDGVKTQFGKGQNPRLGGRPKNALADLKKMLQKNGYSNDDILTAFTAISWSKLSELKELAEDPDAPVILKVVSLTFYKAIQDKDYRKIQAIIEQIIGKPSQKIENDVTVTQNEFTGFNFLPAAAEKK